MPNRLHRTRSTVQWIGLGLFCAALLLFTGMLGLESYTATADVLPKGSEQHDYQRDAIAAAAEERGFVGKTFSNPFSFVQAYEDVFKGAQTSLDEEFEAIGRTRRSG